MLNLAVVTGVAMLIGFRPSASPVEWVAAAGVLALTTFAPTWLCVALQQGQLDGGSGFVGLRRSSVAEARAIAGA